MKEAEELLGLDVGQARIGAARASSRAKIAEPLITLKTEDAYGQLSKLILAHKTDIIVVGLPRNFKDEDTLQTTWIRGWVNQAKKHINLPFYWQDETLSTKLAEANMPVDKKNTPGADAYAAAIILQDFLETPETERELC